MSLVYDLIILIIFFIAFKFYGIYVATTVAIVSAGLQAIVTRIIKGHFDKKQLLIFGAFAVFGGMTLYFHNPIFIKWKPSIIYWIFGGAFLASHFFGKETLIQRMLGHLMEKEHTVPKRVWRNLNTAWTLFFIILGALNMYIAYHFSTNAWVNFKLYGVLGALMTFSIIQSIYLARFFEKN